MKILIDATNIKVGGGVQVAVSVISELIKSKPLGVDFIFTVSSNVDKQIIQAEYNKVVINTNVIDLLFFSKNRNLLIELSEDVDVVFTVFGPPFWSPRKAKHVVGFANAWLVSEAKLAYGTLDFFSSMKLKFKNWLLGHILYKKERFYLTETETIKNLFMNKFECETHRVQVVPNCLPHLYSGGYQYVQKGLVPDQFKNHFKLVSITHNYPHKNLSVIPEVGKILEKKCVKVIFIVTIPQGDYDLLSQNFKKYTYNVGPVNMQECISLYQQVDALFLPTLLECFSVSYLEAMANRLPILTSNLDFAKETCQSAALYFDPLSPADICEKITYLMSNEEVKEKLVDAGNKLILSHPNNEQRVSSYLDFIWEVSNIN